MFAGEAFSGALVEWIDSPPIDKGEVIDLGGNLTMHRVTSEMGARHEGVVFSYRGSLAWGQMKAGDFQAFVWNRVEDVDESPGIRFRLVHVNPEPFTVAFFGTPPILPSPASRQMTLSNVTIFREPVTIGRAADYSTLVMYCNLERAWVIISEMRNATLLEQERVRQMYEAEQDVEETLVKVVRERMPATISVDEGQTLLMELSRLEMRLAERDHAKQNTTAALRALANMPALARDAFLDHRDNNTFHLDHQAIPTRLRLAAAEEHVVRAMDAHLSRQYARDTAEQISNATAVLILTCFIGFAQCLLMLGAWLRPKLPHAGVPRAPWPDPRDSQPGALAPGSRRGDGRRAGGRAAGLIGSSRQ